MSEAPAEPAATGRAPLACPRCGTEVGSGQAWCLECGLAARTRLSPAPNWRTPLVVAGAVGLAAIAALVIAFVVVTGDNAPLPQTTSTAAAAAPAAPATTTAPATTMPPATAPTTSIPAATVPSIVPSTTSTAPTGAG